MKRITKKRLIAITIIVFTAFLVYSDTYTGRYIRWFLPDVYDWKKFPSVKVENNGDSELIIQKKQSDLIEVVQLSTSFENGVKTPDYYKNFNSLWWIMRSGDYFANGHFGQRIYISPGSNSVIVRLGEKNGGISGEFDVFPKIIEELNNNGT